MKSRKLFSAVAGVMLSVSMLSSFQPAITVDALESTVSDTTQYMLRNAGSGKYLTVANAAATNGSNVVQYEADGIADYNTWNVKSGEDGYYYIYSQLSGGSQYLLDLDYSYTENANIEIHENTNSDAQLFRFVENDDGTYTIVTKITEDKGALEVKDASTENGANVQEQTLNGRDCQKWILESVSELVPGDLDMDRKLSVFDLCIMKHKIVQNDFRIYESGISDLNGDGIVDFYDAAMLQDFLLARIDNFEIDEVVLTENTILPIVEENEEMEELIEAPVKAIDSATPSKGNVKMLAVYVDFADKTYSSEAYTNEQIENELFGAGTTAFPYESLSAWFERSSYGNLHLDGDVCRFTCSGNMAEYQSGGFEKMVMEVLSGLDNQIDYSDYDSDNDGVIDCISFTVPLDGADDETLQYWYGCTATWYENYGYSVDGIRLSNYIIMDVMPYGSNMQYMKQTYIHEMGHSMGLPDYYKYQSSDWEGLHGDAGYARMDDSIADFCGFSKLMFGWFKKSEIQTYTGGGAQTFELSDASDSGSCLILPISSSESDYTSEYFFIEYITPSGNNSDMYSTDSGIRIFHVQAELQTSEWGDTSFKYNNYSQYYAGDDNIRVLKLVNDNNGFFHSGDSVRYGTSNFAGYDSSGNQTIDTGYEITIGELSNGKYNITVNKN